MVKKKYIAASMLASSMFLAVGCNNQNTGLFNSTVEESTTSSTKENENIIAGKVINIEGNNLTINVGTLNMGPGGSKGERPEMPQDGERPEMPEGGEKPEMPNNTDKDKSDVSKKPEGQNPPDKNGGEMISLTEEEKVIVLSSDIKITKMSGGKDGNNSEELSVSDIQVGDIVRINYSNDNEVENVEIISIGKMKDSSDKNKEETV